MDLDAPNPLFQRQVAAVTEALTEMYSADPPEEQAARLLDYLGQRGWNLVEDQSENGLPL